MWAMSVALMALAFRGSVPCVHGNVMSAKMATPSFAIIPRVNCVMSPFEPKPWTEGGTTESPLEKSIVQCHSAEEATEALGPGGGLLRFGPHCTRSSKDLTGLE